MWQTYVAWYDLLVQWASLLVSEKLASRYARRTLAEMLVLALNAYETMDGPYMHSTDVLYRYMCLRASDSDPGFVSWAWTKLAYPDIALVADIAALYSAVYEAGYMASLTLSERTEIAALISLYEPHDMSHDQLKRTLEENCPTTHPLRRVVNGIGLSGQVNPHVQAMTLELWTGEEQRGKAWLLRQDT